MRRAGRRTKKLVGWATPEIIRWSLARRFSWLKGAYASGYASLFPDDRDSDDIEVVSLTGMLGRAQEGASPQLLMELMKAFLEEIQLHAEPIAEEQQQWVQLQANVPTWEHACWLNADDIEDIIGDELKKQFVYAKELDGATEENRSKRLLEITERYVPIVDDTEQFRELIDRDVIASQELQTISKS